MNSGKKPKDNPKNNTYRVGPLRRQRLAKLLKVSTIHLSCFSLLYLPSISVIAQDSLMSTIGSGIQMASDILKGVQNQQQQLAQSNFQKAQMQSYVVEAIPSKYFSQCPVIKGVTDFPEGACSVPPTSDPTASDTLIQYKTLAIQNMNTIDNILANGQNSTTPQGIQCLEDSLSRTSSTFQDMINEIQAKITQVKVANQTFKQNITKIEEAMESTRAELYGNPVNQVDKNKNLISGLSQACQDFYGAQGKLQTLQQGLTGIKNESEVIKQDAGNFNNNKNSYTNQVSKQIEAIKNNISTEGLSVVATEDSFTSAINSAIMQSGQSTSFGSISNILSAKVSKFNSDFKILQDDLAAVDYNINIDQLDGSFQDDYTDFSKGSYEYFMKKGIDNCVKGEGTSAALGISTQQVLNGLRSKIESGTATTLDNYRKGLKNILESDAYIEDKLSAIAGLDARFGAGNIYIEIQDAEAQSSKQTPYSLYNNQVESCRESLKQDNSFSTDPTKITNKNSSYEKKAIAAENAIKDMLSLEAEFTADLATSLYNRVINCEGIEPNTQRCSYGSDGGATDLDPASENFCVSNASTCASKITACYNEVNNNITVKQNQMAAQATNYNALVSGVIAQQQNILNEIKAQVISDAEYIKQFVPGASYEFPEDLFIEMPEEEMVDSLGVALRGGEDLASLDDLEIKMDSLKTMLEDQQGTVVAKMQEYIADQQTSMAAESAKWSALNDKCSASQVTLANNVAEANNKSLEQFNESLQFCQKYATLATNPGAGCGDADSLFEDAMNISSKYLANPGEVKNQALQFRSYCNSVNNEGKKKSKEDDSDEDYDEILFSDLSDTCEELDAGDDKGNEKLLSSISNKIIDNLPSGVSSDDKEALEEFFEDPSKNEPSFSSKFKKTAYYRNNLIKVIKNISKIDSYSAPAPEGELKKEFDALKADSEIREGVKNWDSIGFCKRYEVESKYLKFKSCTKDLRGDTPKEDCEKKQKTKTKVSEENAPIAISRAIASLNENVTTSESGRIGEQMRGVACMAQKGNNGSNGDFTSGLSQAAKSLFGLGNNSVIQ